MDEDLEKARQYFEELKVNPDKIEALRDVQNVDYTKTSPRNLLGISTDWLFNANVFLNTSMKIQEGKMIEARNMYLEATRKFQVSGILTSRLTKDEFDEYVKKLEDSDWEKPESYNDFAIYHNRLMELLEERCGGKHYIKKNKQMYQTSQFPLI